LAEALPSSAAGHHALHAALDGRHGNPCRASTLPSRTADQLSGEELQQQ